MGTGRVDKIIRKIAKREGIAVSKVREEMAKAILMGFMNEGTRQKWDSLFGVRKLPSPEEFITKISSLVTK